MDFTGEGYTKESNLHIALTHEQYSYLLSALGIRLLRCKDNAFAQQWGREAPQLQAVIDKVEAAWEQANTPEYPDQIRCVCGAWVWARWNYEEDFYWYQCDVCEHYEGYITVSPEIIERLAEKHRRNEQEAQELFG